MDTFPGSKKERNYRARDYVRVLRDAHIKAIRDSDKPSIGVEMIMHISNLILEALEEATE